MGAKNKIEKQLSYSRVTVMYFEYQRILDSVFWAKKNQYAFWLGNRGQDVKDIKHCIRYFLMQRYLASPYELAKAESNLRKYRNTCHSCMYHSRTVVEEVLSVIKPDLVQQIKEKVYS